MNRLDKRRIKELYDKSGKYWSKTKKRYDEDYFTTFYNLREKSIVQRLVKVKPYSLTLDLCSGPGRWLIEYCRRGSQTIALDFSPKLLKSSKDKLKSSLPLKGLGHFIVADAENIPFKINVFDIVNCFDAFPHLPNQDQALGEIKRVAKKNATIIIEPSNKYSLIGIVISLLRLLSKLFKKINIIRPVWLTNWNIYDTPLKSKRQIKNFRFQIIHIRGVLAMPIPSKRLLKIIYKIEEKLEKNYFYTFFSSRIVFICKNLK
jgi:ubiquinone/menaquinone biosynthesis C-methylase UbiE